MPPPCKFFQEGRCNAGKTCRFSHDLSVLRLPVAIPPCRYFLAGHCAAGNACKFAHVEPRKKPAASAQAAPTQAFAATRQLPVGYAVPSKHSAKEAKWRSQNPAWVAEPYNLGSGEEDATYSMETLAIGGEGQGEGWSCAPAEATAREVGPSYAALAQKCLAGHQAAAQREAPPMLNAGGGGSGPLTDEEVAGRARVKEQVARSADKECGICLERVIAKGEQFGLLDACDHIFCLKCIREWRAVGELDKHVKRSCPLCRETSGLVIPSSFIPDSKDSKDQVLATYHDRLNHIHCKHFRHGDGECPFGTSCLYRHEYRDGTLQRHEAPRLRMDDEGELRAVGHVMLSDMIGIPR